MKAEFSQQIFDVYSNMKFHENLSSGSRAFPCVQTDMSKLTVALRNFAKASKNNYERSCQNISMQAVRTSVEVEL